MPTAATTSASAANKASEQHQEAAFRQRARHGPGERLDAEEGQRRDRVPRTRHARTARGRADPGRCDQQHARAVRGRRLGERRVHARRRRPLQPLEALVGDDADDGALGAPERNPGPERIAAREEPPRRGLVDHEHRGGVGAVALLEQAPAAKRQADRPEVPGRHAAHGDLGPGAGLGFTPDDGERVGEAGIEWMVAGDGHRVHARQAAGARDERAGEAVDLLEIRPRLEIDRVAGRGQLELRLEDAGRRKPGSTCMSRQKLRMSSPAPTTSTAASASSATTSAARTRLRPGPGDAESPSALSDPPQIQPPRLQRGHQAEDQADEEREGEGGAEHAEVERDRRQPRHLRRARWR